MPDQMYLVITLRKSVTDAPEGRAIFDLVRQRLADRPEIIVTGQVANHFIIDEPEPPE